MNIYDFDQPVFQKVICIINEKGLKQKNVALKAGFSQQAFNAMLNGRKLIKVSDIEPITKSLNVSSNKLYQKEGN